MKNINDLWKELQQHPDFVTGTIHTKQSVTEILEYKYEDDEDFMRVLDLFVEENKHDISVVIDNFYVVDYEYGHWSNEMDDLIEKGKQKIFSDDSIN
jgi:hypothetical protein